MSRHLPPRARLLRTTSTTVAALAAFALAGCGGGATWRPAPVEGLIVPPDPPPPFEQGGVWAWEQARAQAAAKAARPAAPPPPPVSAIPGDLPRDLDASLAARAACDKGECALAELVPKGVTPDPGAPAALWSHDLAARATLTFPRSARADVYGVVVKGAVKVRGVEAARAELAGTWAAFRLPGAGGSLRAEGGPARVVLAVVSDGAPIAEAAAADRAKGAPKLAWKARPAPVTVVDLTRAEDLAWASGSMHARIAFEGAGQRAALGVLLASKDARVAPHAHDGAWEILGALRPSGAFRRASAPGKDDLATTPLAAGAVVTVPKGVAHAWDAAAPDGLVAVQLFVPPGPEQRFRRFAHPEAK